MIIQMMSNRQLEIILRGIFFLVPIIELSVEMPWQDYGGQ